MDNKCSELAIYSPESVADSSPTSSWDTDQLSLLSGSHTPAESCANEPQKDGSPACQCGKGMFDCSIHPSTPESWTASMRDSLAKTLALLESRQAYLREPDQVFTAKSCASLAWFDRDTCSWRTYQQSFLTDSEPYSQTWPRWGMTLDGCAYAHPMSERRITETGGSYLPTPTRGMACHAQLSVEANDKEYKRSMRDRGGASSLAVHVQQQANKQIWPTPSALDPQLERRGKHGDHFQTRSGSVRRKNADGSSSNLGLPAAVKYWPTPTAHNAKETNAPSESERNTPTLAAQVGGQLNPDWVGWLMGFPMSWAVIGGGKKPMLEGSHLVFPPGSANSKATATHRSPSKLPQPGECSEVAE